MSDSVGGAKKAASPEGASLTATSEAINRLDRIWSNILELEYEAVRQLPRPEKNLPLPPLSAAFWNYCDGLGWASYSAFRSWLSSDGKHLSGKQEFNISWTSYHHCLIVKCRASEAIFHCPHYTYQKKVYTLHSAFPKPDSEKYGDVRDSKSVNR